MVKDILNAADINQDGKISFEGPFLYWLLLAGRGV